MSKVATLYSSSKGNCTYIGHAGGGILIDAGVSGKKIDEGLYNIGVDIESIKAIFITHEHIDHTSGAKTLATKYDLPVFATSGTLLEMQAQGSICAKNKCNVIDESGVTVGDIHVKPFKTMHDSSDSCGFLANLGGLRKVAVCTDLGCVTDEVLNSLTGADLVVLESNHDVNMLQNGLYPYALKRRVMSDVGHLSNGACAEILPKLVKNGTTRIILSHLSERNNMEVLARQTALMALKAAEMKENIDFLLYVAKAINNRAFAI